MFRFISAWLQAVFRYITAWLQAAAAAADDPFKEAAAGDSFKAAMDFPATVSLGPLHRQLHSFQTTKNNLPDGVSEGEVRHLEADLEELFTELKILSEADDPTFTAMCWMKEVRELRYDADDFFGEVLRSCAGARRSFLLTIILWIPSKLKRQCQVAEAFSDLRARVKDASQRRQSFQICPATIRAEFGQINVSPSEPKLSLQLVGLEESMDKLVKLLAFDSEDAEQQVQVVPVFGFAGVGKTTLARTFYRNFGGKFQCRALVRVSRNPDMRRMLSSMLSQIKAPPVHGFPDVQDLIDIIREYLQCKRYLIIIDDLWASSTWDIISRAFPDGDCCSRIIVTTEIEDVALSCSRYQFKNMYEMSPLNVDQSRKLFLGRVFGSESGCPPDFKEVTYEIIQKCGGLPLAIENIGSMLACELDVDQWKHVRDSLPSVLSLRTSPSSEGLKEVFNIIYNNLSPYLKTCVLYLIMYPEGNTISKEDLVKQWVAEDFICEGQNREKTARGYFDELVSRGMVQPVDINYNDEVLTCTVHHMVLDLIRYKSLEENFIINVSYFQTTPDLPDKVRRLAVQFGGAKCANIPADFMMIQVRSLIFFGFLNCVPSFVEYKLLRVLILHIWADESKIFDLTGIGELFQLRYLKIDGNITVHLPDEIRQLNLLETLELHAPVNDMPDISCLPLLRTLSYFDLSKNSLENVQSLGELNNLEDLHLIWSNTAEPHNLKNSMQCLGSILCKLSNLKSFTLVRAASSHADVLDDAGGASVGISGDVLSSVPSPPALLQRLELSGHCCIFSSLPEWTKELGNLCILKIAVRKLLRKDIDVLKGLPALMALSLYVWTAPVGKVVIDNEGFSALKYFKLTCAAPCVAFLEGAMPSVRELKLAFNADRMEQYRQIVAGLEYLIELREITAEVGGTDTDESDKRYAESAFRDAIANHPCTPVITVRRVQHLASHSSDPYVVDYHHLACMVKKGVSSRQKTSFSPTSMKDLPSKSRSSGDQHAYLQVTEALAQAGLEYSNLIVGIDFTKSNEWTGQISYNRRCLHDIGNTPNPYEQVISIIGRTLSAFDDNNLIPCFGFGDASTHDTEVFSFYPENQPCKGFKEALERYREIVPTLRLSGPTSFAALIETAMGIVDSTGGQYHVLLIIADGQVTRSVNTQSGKLSSQERVTIDAIVKASHFPLSIVLVGVGDGPWDMMHKFDDNIPARSFNNFQFVNFTEIMSKSIAADRKEVEFALSALMKIPMQYKATLDLQLLGRRQGIPPRVPLPPPIKTAY